MKRPDSDEITHAQAGRLEYDFVAGVVEFSEQAIITGGGNQISSNYLVYNIGEQRISAQSGGAGDPKVRITYTPGPDIGPTADATSGPAGAESEDAAGNPDTTPEPEPEDASGEEAVEDGPGEPVTSGDDDR